MANTFTTQTLVDGERNVVIQAYMASDGASGELSDQVLVDASSLSGAPDLVSVVSVHSSLNGFAVTLEWDATTDVPFLELASGETDYDWKKVGALHNNAGAGVTGDILVNTSGFTASGDNGHITIRGRKKWL